MTELVQTDSSQEVAAEETTNDGLIDLGADLDAPAVEAAPVDDESLPAGATEARTTDKDAPERPAEIPNNIGDVDVDSLPAQLQPLAKQLKGRFTQGMQALAGHRRELEAQQQERLEERVNRLETPPQEEPDPLSSLRSTLDQDEQRSLDVISEVSKMTVGKELEAQTEKVAQLTEFVRRIALHLANGATQTANTAASQAREKYPDIDNFADQVNALTGVQNRVTGLNYTPTEAYELIHGISAQQSAQLKEQEDNVRRTATGSLTPPSPVSADSEQGALSEEQLASELRKLGLTP
tara:strand:+ start:3476 stop:4360 length:885 start_codon:yes stop_codon:yes gene_type:complete